MRYNVAQLLKEPTGATRQYQLDEVFSAEDRILDQAKGEVDVIRTHQGLLVTANLAIESTVSCGRCLEGYALKANLFLEEEFLPVFDINTGRRIEFDQDDANCIVEGNHELDLTDILQQYVISELPMKPLCRVDCLGLCHVCGDNLNKNQCNCYDESYKLVTTTLAQLLPKD